MARVVFKDESARFGLGSFKALGGAYAVAHLAKQAEAAGGSITEVTVATATDGNHGRSISWGASRAGCKAKIYIHAHVSKAREEAMAAFGADVIRINGNYEASLAACKEDAAAHGWQIVSDTSWPGYTEVPLTVMAGYTLMAREALDQLWQNALSFWTGDPKWMDWLPQAVRDSAMGDAPSRSLLLVRLSGVFCFRFQAATASWRGMPFTYGFAPGKMAQRGMAQAMARTPAASTVRTEVPGLC